MNDAPIIEAARALAEHTVDECGKCRAPHSCCSVQYCNMALAIAYEEWSTDLSDMYNPKARVPFLHSFDGEVKCAVPPHMRPLCTAHTCDINNLGFKMNDPGQKWTKVYFKLRGEYEKLAMERTNNDR